MTFFFEEVNRRLPLPIAAPRGRLAVPIDVLSGTRRALAQSRGPDGPHEGLVFWAGRQQGDETRISLAIVPSASHGWGHVHVPEGAALEAARAARARGCGILAQVHSHPGRDVRHSDGDDSLVYMPFEGMWSVVVARYGRPVERLADGLGLHQFRDGRWTWVEPQWQALAVLGATP